jgi:hypothetical protein
VKKFFISWAGNLGQQLALAVQGALDQITVQGDPHARAIDTFVSTTSIENGSNWRQALAENLGGSARGLMLVTQDVIRSDWFLHEASVQNVVYEKSYILLVDAPRAILPEPLKDRQAHHLSNETLSAVIRDIAKWSSAQLPATTLTQLNQLVAEVRQEIPNHYVPGDEALWQGKVERVLTITQQGGSPYAFDSLLRVAKRRATFVAQNHWFVTRPQNEMTMWEKVRDALRRGVNVDIVAMDPEAKPKRLASYTRTADACNTWAHYMKAVAFPQHVQDCMNTLQNWTNRAESEGPGKFTAYRAYLTPLTLSVIDPDDECGFLVLSPRPPDDANYPRPQFIIYKQTNRQVFEYYWGTTINCFDNSYWLPMLPAKVP